MLCTSMRLTDRRFRIKTTVRSNQIDSNSTATITIGTTPFVRPCTIIKMFENDTNGKGVKPNASMQEQFTEANTTNRVQTANGSPDTMDQPNNNKNSNRCGGKDKRMIKSASTPSCRAPLIIVTLFIPTEAKTLAPKDLKRDQRRRPPSFCQNFQRQTSLNDQCSCKTNNELDFLVRGKEIHESGHDSVTIEEFGEISTMPGAHDTVENDNDVDDDEFNSCCACFIEMEKENSNLEVPTTVDRTELCVNFENYQMDSNGYLPPVPAIPITRDIVAESDGHSSIATKRICSPSTSQIIRITMSHRNVGSICKDNDE